MDELIDVHCHILPGMDDGPSTVVESIMIAKKAARLGINKIVATPHHRNGSNINEPSDIVNAVNTLNEQLREAKVPVKILPGQETRIYQDIGKDLKSGKILSLNQNTKYVCIELPPTQISYLIENIIYDIQMAGYIPVISNPEMNEYILENPNLLYIMVKNGALVQVSAGSIAGVNGTKIQKVTDKLLAADLVHFVGSNAFNSSDKGFYFKEAMEHMKKLEPGLAHQLFHNNESLIHGAAISRSEPKRITSKPWKIFSR